MAKQCIKCGKQKTWRMCNYAGASLRLDPCPTRLSMKKMPGSSKRKEFLCYDCAKEVEIKCEKHGIIDDVQFQFGECVLLFCEKCAKEKKEAARVARKERKEAARIANAPVRPVCPRCARKRVCDRCGDPLRSGGTLFSDFTVSIPKYMCGTWCKDCTDNYNEKNWGQLSEVEEFRCSKCGREFCSKVENVAIMLDNQELVRFLKDKKSR
jgi:hypothetical protein